MAALPGSSRNFRWLLSVAMIALGLLVRAPGLLDPLLEGAAGKQTHQAMVARNLYRGRSTWSRPIVDDVGHPGYFVKELPVVPGLVALAYWAVGGVHEWLGRLISAAFWLAATPLLLGLARRSGSDGIGGAVAGAWYVVAPLGIVYSRAFMNDAAAVALSIATLDAALAWRTRPGVGRAAGAGALFAASLLLKLHAIFWLGPALAAVSIGREPSSMSPSASSAESARRPRPGALLVALLCLAAGAVGAAAWYAHAAAVHRQFPVPGASVPHGWVNPALWSRPDLYAAIARQDVTMVLTPLGALLALAGACTGGRLALAERALAAWWLGVLLQCVVFAPRVFDDLSRGTEYYQLAAVPAAAIFIGRGFAAACAALAGLGRRAPAVGGAVMAAVLSAGAALATAGALAAPARYSGLLRDCDAVKRLTDPSGEMVVIADRGGTVLYYCDRRGSTFLPASSARPEALGEDAAAGSDDLRSSLGGARYLYVPFPDVLDGADGLKAYLEREWHRVPGSAAIDLYERNEAGHPG
jgi:hypothetical protein